MLAWQWQRARTVGRCSVTSTSSPGGVKSTPAVPLKSTLPPARDTSRSRGHWRIGGHGSVTLMPTSQFPVDSPTTPPPLPSDSKSRFHSAVRPIGNCIISGPRKSVTKSFSEYTNGEPSASMNVVWLTLAPAQPGQSVEKVSHEVQSSGFADPRAAPMMRAELWRPP